jgi:large subunit ribosomal protein L5
MQRNDDITPQKGEEQAAEVGVPKAPKPAVARQPRKRSGDASASGGRGSTGSRIRSQRKSAQAQGAETASESTNGATPAVATPGLAPRMLVRYREEIRPTLVREFGYKSSMQAPGVKKVVLNMGLGEALLNAKALETAPAQMAAISGQRPVITKAKQSIAAFKIREGMSIGCSVTLRGQRMWEFLDRFIILALARIRDFRGVSRTAFDGQGNYSLGIREQTIFPEVDYGQVDRIRGLQVTITTSARSDHEGFRLLELLGMPFAREDQVR